jgi:GNAT superfamily N-acetyltransferase
MLQLLAAPECSDEDIQVAAGALHLQWPRGGLVEEYAEKLCPPTACRSTVGATAPPRQLPCSFLLIENQTVVGHGRLTECFEGAGGRAAAATFILVVDKLRNQGYGSQLMALLERTCIDLGYHYLYLWTASAIPFYRKIGYCKTERVSLFSACLKTLKCDQVSNLEAMLAKRSNSHGTATSRHHETVMLPPDAVKEGDIWMRKRLVESVASVSVSMEQRIDDVKAAISNGPDLRWELFMQQVPWQQQVGPSCGLAALRMLRDFYYCLGNDSTNEHGNKGLQMPSLFVEAQSKGYTVDGEIFDVGNLLKLALFCGLRSEIWSFSACPPSLVLKVLLSGGTIIVPYDSQPSTRRPCKNLGQTAHYGIIVGILFGFPTSSSSDLRVMRTTEGLSSSAEDARNVLLLVQHSLSAKLAIASWSEFFDSNQQLETIDEKKYRLPDKSSLNLRDRLLVCLGKLDSVDCK